MATKTTTKKQAKPLKKHVLARTAAAKKPVARLKVVAKPAAKIMDAYGMPDEHTKALQLTR